MLKIEKLKYSGAALAALFFGGWANLANADTANSVPSLGEAAVNALAPVGVFTTALYNICYILGTLFVLGSLIRFKEYRENPSQTPISRALVVFLFGLILFAVPFISKLSSSAHLLGA